MNLLNRTFDILQSARSVIYRPWLKSLFQRFGVENHIRNVYWKILIAIAGKQQATIGNITATFNVNSRVEYWRVKNFIGERPVLEDLLDELSSEDVFYDVGANIGLYCCLASQICTDGHVVAFEPHPETYGRLQKNLSLNCNNYSVYQYALADQTGTMQLGLPEDNGRPGTFMLGSESAGPSIDVNVVPGDDLRDAKSIPAPTVLKIDVEGAEITALEGLRRTIERNDCRLVYVEVHPDILQNDGLDPSSVEETLGRAGYQVSTLHTREGERFLKAVR